MNMSMQALCKGSLQGEHCQGKCACGTKMRAPPPAVPHSWGCHLAAGWAAALQALLALRQQPGHLHLPMQQMPLPPPDVQLPSAPQHPLHAPVSYARDVQSCGGRGQEHIFHSRGPTVLCWGCSSLFRHRRSRCFGLLGRLLGRCCCQRRVQRGLLQCCCARPGLVRVPLLSQHL